jgi:UDP-xylose/UDP-N-acetylglucosamine transporter B4
VCVILCPCREDPAAGHTITFFQFLFIAVEGFFVTTKCLTVRNKVPITDYMKMVCLFFVVSVMNNYAFSFNIPLPLHMIFRSGSLIANMLLGVLIMDKVYPRYKYASVFVISCGIFLATYASSQQVTGAAKALEEGSLVAYLWLLTGIVFLTVALLLSSLMGIFQEKLYAKHGKHPREAMFYCHVLPMPAFLIFAPDIINRCVMYTASDPISIVGLGIPKLWVYIIGNMMTQYICIRGVFTLTTECPSLVVTLVVTLRKFISLLISIFYFQNPFTLTHWIATTFVFGGTLVFSDALSHLRFKKSKAE